MTADSFQRHDQMGFIGPERMYAAGISLPVPMNYIMGFMQTHYMHGAGMQAMQGGKH